MHSSYQIVLPAVLAAVFAVQSAMLVLLLSLRRRLRRAPADAAPVPAELGALIAQLSTRSEAALAELDRQKAELSRLLEEMKRPAVSQPWPGGRAPALLITRADGESTYALARRAGVSLEEVRLRLARVDAIGVEVRASA